MSTVRSIERRIFQRRQLDREMHAFGESRTAIRVRGVEWNGVWAGFLVFVGLGMLLMFLVLGIGFSSVNPLNGASWASMGSGVAIWSVIALLISTFVGALVAGQTPPASRRHGMMKGLVLWGLVMLSTLLMAGWLAGHALTAAASTAGGAATAVTGAAATGTAALRGKLQSQGVTITRAQTADYETRLASGHSNSAARVLARDSGVPLARAQAITGRLKSSASGLGSAAAGLGTTAAKGAKTGGSAVTWAGFWLALIGLGCALAGGAVGGGGMRRTPART